MDEPDVVVVLSLTEEFDHIRFPFEQLLQVEELVDRFKNARGLRFDENACPEKVKVPRPVQRERKIA